MKLGRALVVGSFGAAGVFAACSSPDYKFVGADGGGPTTSSTSSSTSSSSSGGGIVDAGYDAQPADFAPIVIQGHREGGLGTFQSDCTSFALADGGVNPQFATDSAGNGHCFVFFFNSPYGRRWVDAQYACSRVTYAGKAARLATFHEQPLAQNVDVAYKDQLRTWIGLQNVGDATQKSGFAWIDTKQSPEYDGWTTGEPSEAGLPCVNLAGNGPFWTASDCTVNKGFLCEFEDPGDP